MCVTGASSVIKVDTYVEAALEETKLVKGTASRQRTPGYLKYGCACRPFAVRLARPQSGAF